ncbi:hypothetical protein IV04_13055 [Serratia sp. Ag1]|nr:hypothetical protein JV45_13330 [Serratia sp. Ag2]KFK98323.1 hypothetical protein IV04_13055 [Serratia sp. Ag1]
MIDAGCRVEQALVVLSTWLEITMADDRSAILIGAVMSLLDGVPEVIEKADAQLAGYVMREHLEGKA